jgi:hypothetical protein
MRQDALLYLFGYVPLTVRFSTLSSVAKSPQRACQIQKVIQSLLFYPPMMGTSFAVGAGNTPPMTNSSLS